MGCWSSKHEESGLIVLCRARRALIREAVDHRYALAAAHASYFQALAIVGDALVRYAREGIPPSPVMAPEVETHVITLPTSRKGTETDGSGESSATPLSHSLSDQGSHLHFSSDSEVEAEVEGGKGGDPAPGPIPSYFHMRSSTATPSIVYYGEPSDGHYGFPGGYVDDHNYYYGTSVSPHVQPMPSPPPPPPAQGFGWDFFNPFYSYNQYLPGYSPDQYGMKSIGSSPSSSEVRAREGIPDLEDERELEPPASVKNGKVVAEDLETEDSGVGSSKKVQEKKSEELEKGNKSSSGEKGSKVSSADKGGNGNSSMNIVGSGEEQGSGSKKKGVSFQEGSSLISETSDKSDGGLLYVDGNRDSVEALGDINQGFKSAVIGSEEVSKLLEAEERLRSVYEKKYRRLRSLDDRGAEPRKINAVQASIRSVRTKTSIAIAAADLISRRVRVIMDEELQPQLVKLIQGLMKMWRLLAGFHQKQLNAITASGEPKLGIRPTFKDSARRATVDLELILSKWHSSFDVWISTQKDFVNTLNRWLLKWLPGDREPVSPASIGAPPVFILANDWSEAINRCSEAEVKAAIRSFAADMRELRERQDEELRQYREADSLSREYSAELKNLQKEEGGRDVSVPGDDRVRVVALDAMKKRLERVRAEHDETLRHVQQVTAASLSAGLVPVFRSLSSFCSDVLRAYEALRIPNKGSGS